MYVRKTKSWLYIFFRNSNNWKYQTFIGNKWTKVNQESRQKYRLNAYRVLLTRARQGMVIVVPNGTEIDHTRPSANYDPTWDYLINIGLKPIET